MSEKTTCSIEGCDRPARGRGWCDPHYKRWLRHGDPLGGRWPAGVCTEDGCEARAKAHGLCPKHYQRWIRDTAPYGHCRFQDCDRVAINTRGWCVRHYQRWRIHGDPAEGMFTVDRLPRSATSTERFLAKVDKNGPVPERRPDLGPCWLWTGVQNGRGYGCFYIEPNQGMVASRASWILFVGPIPDGFEVDHLCRVTLCVNPHHLEPVTPDENKRRTRKRFCCRGHDMEDPDNVKIRANGDRRCLGCQASYNAERYGRAS